MLSIVYDKLWINWTFDNTNNAIIWTIDMKQNAVKIICICNHLIQTHLNWINNDCIGVIYIIYVTITLE